MNPRNFQSLASQLVLSRDPAQLRSAISRAYYASYNVGVEILKGMGFRIPKGPGGHGDVAKRLGNCGNTDVTRISSQIAGLHSKRIKADYRLDDKAVEKQKNAQALVAQGKRIIQTLDTQCHGSERQQIIETIREWERKTGSARP